MKFAVNELRLTTTEPVEVIDITEHVETFLAQSRLKRGLLTLISGHTTAFVAVNECESRLKEDMVEFLSKIAPKSAGYRHDLHPIDDRPNAHAHLAGLFMNASESIPIADGKLLLGTWQSILFVELDGPRVGRSVRVHMLGEL
jgi:secondary thiamine-phosphate synthase enzyme